MNYPAIFIPALSNVDPKYRITLCWFEPEALSPLSILPSHLDLPTKNCFISRLHLNRRKPSLAAGTVILQKHKERGRTVEKPPTSICKELVSWPKVRVQIVSLGRKILHKLRRAKGLVYAHHRTEKRSCPGQDACNKRILHLQGCTLGGSATDLLCPAP